ncbi:MAG: hypothetical protein ACRDS0_20825, partial [Pseudonocardiaceae bacterium]
KKPVCADGIRAALFSRRTTYQRAAAYHVTPFSPRGRVDPTTGCTTPTDTRPPTNQQRPHLHQSHANNNLAL